MIVIVDYGIGNIGSIRNMLKKIGVDSTISSDKEIIYKSKKIILPGVGSFDTGMNNIINLKLLEVLNYKVLEEKIPILGICLGMQLLSKSSDEGAKKGLGYIDAATVKFDFSEDMKNIYKVPHMGWNYVHIKKESRLFNDMYSEPRFYFVHSYFFKPNINDDVLTTTDYGVSFTSTVERNNIIGVQFHPEKSHKFGMKLLKNFVELY